MTKQQIVQAIESYISGQGNQAGLQGLADILHALNNETEMVVTFNAYETISNELSIWSAVVYDAPSDTVYHCALYLYYDGRILYNVDVMQH